MVSKKIDECTVAELKSVLNQNNLATSGAKADLIARLREYLQTETVEIGNTAGENSAIAQLTEQVNQLTQLVKNLVTVVSVSRENSSISNSNIVNTPSSSINSNNDQASTQTIQRNQFQNTNVRYY